MARIGKEQSRRHRTFRQSLRSESIFVLLRYLLLDGILTLNELSLALRMCKSRTAGWNHGAALFLRNQPGGLKLLHSGKLRAQAALATGTARRWETAFRIFCWLEVADFDLVFLFLLLCLVLHVAFHLFVVCACVDRLAGTGGASVQLARRPPVGIRGRLTAFRIFWWLKVREFDLFFLFLFLGLVLHVICSFHLFVVCSRSAVICDRSLMYCVEFLRPLRGKFGNFFKQKVKDSAQSEVEKNVVAFVPFC